MFINKYRLLLRDFFANLSWVFLARIIYIVYYFFTIFSLKVAALRIYIYYLIKNRMLLTVSYIAADE